MGKARNRPMSDNQAEDELNNTLVESGERDRLRKHLGRQLDDSGWREQLKVQIREIVQERGPENITMEELVQEMAPKATGMVPDRMKRDLMKDITRFLEKNARPS